MLNRRRFLGLLAALPGLGFLSRSAPEPDPLVDWISFDEGTGTTFTDYGGAMRFDGRGRDVVCRGGHCPAVEGEAISEWCDQTDLVRDVKTGLWHHRSCHLRECTCDVDSCPSCARRHAEEFNAGIQKVIRELEAQLRELRAEVLDGPRWPKAGDTVTIEGEPRVLVAVRSGAGFVELVPK